MEYVDRQSEARLNGKILSLDEIKQGLSEMAQNGEGAQRAQAYRMLMSMDAAAAALPDPLPDVDLVDRLARLIRAAGIATAQVAYQRAFPRARAIGEAPKLKETDIPHEQLKTLPRTLKHLYRMFPEIKRPGFPTTYPVGRGPELQQDWCRRKARQILLDREQAKVNENARIEAETDSTLRGSHGGDTETPPLEAGLLPVAGRD